MRTSWLVVVACGLAAAVSARAQEESAAALAGRLRVEIESLRPGQAVRRAVGWRTCLLEAFREAQEKKKPVLIWAFRGDPDEGRC